MPLMMRRRRGRLSEYPYTNEVADIPGKWLNLSGESERISAGTGEFLTKITDGLANTTCLEPSVYSSGVDYVTVNG